jgi:transcription initiation factor TFIIIB Brf1 subunit/transcription initiation factor TFIIB
MDRHFLCACGGTAWVNREAGATTIECARCGLTVSAETLTLVKVEWQKCQSNQGGKTKMANRNGNGGRNS